MAHVCRTRAYVYRKRKAVALAGDLVAPQQSKLVVEFVRAAPQVALSDTTARDAWPLSPPQHTEAGARNALPSALQRLPQASVMHRLVQLTQPVDDWAWIEVHTNGFNLTIYNVKPVDHRQRAKWRLHFE